MSDTKHSPEAHSPEPWWVETGLDSDDVMSRWCETTTAAVAQGCMTEDAERIVACVNACAGIPTEALESGALGKALDYGAEVVSIHADATRDIGPVQPCASCDMRPVFRSLGRLK